MVDFVSFAYAATVTAGGIMGYVKAASVPSLAAGLLFGSILTYGSYQSSRDPSNYSVVYGTSAALGALMGYRYMNSGKFMPAGLVALLSGLMVLRFTAKYFGVEQTGRIRTD